VTHEPETLARIVAAFCIFAVGALVVAFVGWLINL
jgi:hypothetical protein